MRQQAVCIRLATDFTRFPFGRYRSDSKKASGEVFRDDVLIPKLAEAEQVTINLDGTIGLSSGFLEETFGGLVRKRLYTREQLRSKLVLVCNDTSIITEINQYMDEAAAHLS